MRRLAARAPGGALSGLGAVVGVGVLVFVACGDGEQPVATPTLTCQEAIPIIEQRRIAIDAAASTGCVDDADCVRSPFPVDCGHLGVTTACVDAILITNQQRYDDDVDAFAAELCPQLAEPCEATMECRRIDYVNAGAFCRQGACVGFPD